MATSNVKYYCMAFNAAGKRIAASICNYDPADNSNADSIEKIKDNMKALQSNAATIEIIDADTYDAYVQKGYVRDTDTGKPIPYIAPELTEAEKKVAAADALKAEYEPQIEALKDALATATLAGDTETIESLKVEYNDLIAEYNTKLEAINNG